MPQTVLHIRGGNITFDNDRVDASPTDIALLGFTPTGSGGPYLSTSTNFQVASGKVYQIGGVNGVACSGSPTGSFASVGGIVTHC